MNPALLSVRWAMIPFFVSTAAACDFVAVDMEGMVMVTTEVCWDGPNEVVVVEIQISETCQQTDFGRDRPSEVVIYETQTCEICQQPDFGRDGAGEVVGTEIQRFEACQ